MKPLKGTASEDARVLWRYACIYEHDEELWLEAWLALWRQIAREYVFDFMWWAATGEVEHGQGPFPEPDDELRAQIRAFLRSVGAILPEEWRFKSGGGGPA